MARKLSCSLPPHVPITETVPPILARPAAGVPSAVVAKVDVVGAAASCGTAGCVGALVGVDWVDARVQLASTAAEAATVNSCAKRRRLSLAPPRARAYSAVGKGRRLLNSVSLKCDWNWFPC
jgi:hypothetical protein